MQLKTKKIIATEFIIFILVISAGLIAFLSTYPYNYYWRQKLNKLSAKIALNKHLSDSLAQPFDSKASKQFWYYASVNDKFSFSETSIDTQQKLWTILYRVSRNDSISYRWENKWTEDLIKFHRQMGFQTPNDFNNFIISTRISVQDVNDKSLAGKINAETNQLSPLEGTYFNKVLLWNGQINFTLYVLSALFLVFFIIRYLYYGIKASINILKQP